MHVLILTHYKNSELGMEFSDGISSVNIDNNIPWMNEGFRG